MATKSCPGRVRQPLRWAGMQTIMVVDDEPAVRQLTARILQGAGYTTIELTDGLEAWNYLKRAGMPVDAILSDVVMPRLTGPELVVRLLQSRPTLPIVLMSAYSAEELRARGLADCPVPLLTKPFDPDGLLSLMKSVLSKGAHS
jgi:two-component system, cell cycle sensor histidine kinase and response regulator CckA